MPYCEYSSPVGTLTVVASDEAVTGVWWPDDPRTPLLQDVDPEQALLQETVGQLDEYFAGSRTRFELPLADSGTDFQRAAWAVLRTIPYGQTISYGEQARRLGDPAKARAVGSANGRNPLSIIVPCHRVVATSGALTGFAGGMPAKQWLLEFERSNLAAAT